MVCWVRAQQVLRPITVRIETPHRDLLWQISFGNSNFDKIYFLDIFLLKMQENILNFHNLSKKNFFWWSNYPIYSLELCCLNHFFSFLTFLFSNSGQIFCSNFIWGILGENIFRWLHRVDIREVTGDGIWSDPVSLFNIFNKM